jgi:hypothetical protein
VADVNVDALVKSYEALEKIAIGKMDDSEKVQWYAQRAISAEEANRQLGLQAAAHSVVTKFPLVEAEDLAGAKNQAEMELIAARIQGKMEKAQAKGQEIVEAAVKDALGKKDDEIQEMRKVYGKPRTPQAGDVTGSESQRRQEEAKVGLGAEGQKKVEYGTMEAVSDAARRAAEPLLGALGFIEREK